MEQKIKVRFKGYDDKLLDKTIGEIIHTVRRTGAEIVGPIPLPTRKNRYTVLRSPHVENNSKCELTKGSSIFLKQLHRQWML